MLETMVEHLLECSGFTCFLFSIFISTRPAKAAASNAKCTNNTQKSPQACLPNNMSERKQAFVEQASKVSWFQLHASFSHFIFRFRCLAPFLFLFCFASLLQFFHSFFFCVRFFLQVLWVECVCRALGWTSSHWLARNSRLACTDFKFQKNIKTKQQKRIHNAVLQF